VDTIEKVSIIIPTYNRSALLKKAILSALNQSYSNMEILVLDNNSSDDTEETINTIPNPEVKYLRNEKNIGPIPNWRKGLEAATGKYGVFLCDDDEFLDKDYIKIAVSILEEHENITLVIPSAIIKKEHTLTFSGFKESTILSGKEFLLNFWTKKYIIPNISNVFDLSAARKLHVLYDNTILMSDIELWLMMMIYSDVYCLDLPSIIYNFHGDNIVLSMRNNNHIQNAAFIGNIMKFATKEWGEDFCSTLHFNLLNRFVLFSSSINGFFIDYKTFRAIAQKANYQRVSYTLYQRIKLQYLISKIKKAMVRFRKRSTH